jgi:hypothetical protein
MRFLELTLKREWFDMIARGEKKEEYRNPTDWILSRLNGKEYDFVRFRNGYNPGSPICVCEYRGWKWGHGRAEWGGRQGGSKYIIISLGKITPVARLKSQTNIQSKSLMPTNWKTLVEKKNAKTFVLPPGWDSRAVVAEQLDCSEDKVDDHLRPALKAGEVEKRQFPVWDADLGRKVLVVAYHVIDRPTEAPKPTAEQVKALRAEGKSWPECGRALGVSGDVCRRLAGAK